MLSIQSSERTLSTKLIELQLVLENQEPRDINTRSPKIHTVLPPHYITCIYLRKPSVLYWRFIHSFAAKGTLASIPVVIWLNCSTPSPIPRRWGNYITINLCWRQTLVAYFMLEHSPRYTVFTTITLWPFVLFHNRTYGWHPAAKRFQRNKENVTSICSLI